ncbi:hypothetical protein [Alteraurantiacibacter palmitatis]|uniref:Uncharacterized protein n=1 Tax=Alteraurantiacibacter palmitatis TaxID=2054628 RepID=A0ABV7E9I5_9SPHN
MSIRFAAPKGAIRNRMAASRARLSRLRPANDNAPPAIASGDAALAAALRHFAAHGMAAAERALEQAEQARIQNDAQSFAWWVAICGQLDRQMARRISQSAP